MASSFIYCCPQIFNQLWTNRKPPFTKSGFKVDTRSYWSGIYIKRKRSQLFIYRKMQHIKHLLSKPDEEDVTFPEPYDYVTDIMLKELLDPVKQTHCCEEGYEEVITFKECNVSFNTAVEFECFWCEKHCVGWLARGEKWSLKPGSNYLKEFCQPAIA